MQVKSIAECSKGSNELHSAILLTFIELPFVIKIFVLSIFEWPFYTGFSVLICQCIFYCLFSYELADLFCHLSTFMGLLFTFQCPLVPSHNLLSWVN